MAYEKYIWQDGDYLTTARMNHIEEAIEQLSENPISQEELTRAIDTAVGNIGADSLKAISYDHEQTGLTDAQKEIARNNMNVYSREEAEALVGADEKIKINRNNNTNNINYPLLVSQSDNPLPNSSVQGQLHIDNSKNPTINYSTGVLAANAFAGDGTQLTNIDGTKIINGAGIQNLNAQNIVNGILEIEHGGTGTGTLAAVPDRLKVVATTTLAPAFDENTLYNKNDYCTNTTNNRIYRCIANTSQGTWDNTSSNWEGPIVFSSVIADIDNKATANVVTMGAATSATDGTQGLVPAPEAGDEGKFLGGDAQWHTVVTDIDFSRAVTGQLGIVNGGTGATTSAGALSNLGAASAEDLANAISAIAESYDENTSYNAGDYCIYNNKLYHCKAGEGITDESPDAEESEYWEEVTVMDSIVDVAANLNPESIGAASATDLAADYDSTANYEIGDYCIYAGHLYKCNTAIDGGETWNSEHWTATTVDEAMGLAAEAAAAAVSGVVRYDMSQTGSMSTEQQSQARTNINAASLDDVITLNNNSSGALFSNIADTFSDASSYSIGDYCIYNNQLYQCIEDIDNPGAWTGNTNWTMLTITDAINNIHTGISFNGGYVDSNNDLYFTYQESQGAEPEVVNAISPIHIPATGGGGGTSGTIVTLLQGSETPATARNGNPCIYKMIVDSSDATDRIDIVWFVNNVEVAANDSSSNGSKTFEFDVGPYLQPSTKKNSVKVVITTSSGGYLSREYNVETTAFEVKWGSGVESIILRTNNMNVQLPIEVFAEKNSNNDITVKVGQTVVQTYSTTGRKSIQAVIDKSYFTIGANTVTVNMASHSDPEDTAPSISCVVVWAYGATTPIITFANSTQTCVQYDIVDIEYFVYDPNDDEVNCTLQIGSNEPEIISAKRVVQTKQYSPLAAETITITLSYNLLSTTMTLTSTASDYVLTYYSDATLNYNMDPLGHNNAESNREQFGSCVDGNGDTQYITFSNNFNWDKGGFQTDTDGTPAFVVKKGDKIILPKSLFEDSDSLGKTVDISFSIKNSEQYDAIAMFDINSTDINNLNNINFNSADRGIILRANNGEIRLGNNAGEEIRYCEETRIDMSILVESDVSQRLATVWLDGIPSKVKPYSATMLEITQDEEHPKAMVIGSDYCDVWIYAIRTYTSALTRDQMIQNYISCGNNTEEKISRYRTNNILDNDGNVDLALLKRAAPSLTIIEIEMPKMTTNKNDKVTSNVTITDGATSLVLNNVVVKVQGTSSAAYGRSAYNLDIDFSKTDQTYKISENSIPVNYLNVKVNVASSENANNVNAVDWYNTYQPYRLAYRGIAGVRDTIEAKPCAVFVTNNSDESKWFSSQYVAPNETILYAMGDLCNSKKNLAVFGENNVASEINPYPTKACIEVSGNDTDPEQFISMSYKGETIAYNADDGEWQTSELVENEEHQMETKVTKHFEWRMEPSSANLQDVVDAWEDTVAWVVSTRNNPTKFKNEVDQYFAIDSLLYHFLFIEYFAAYDNVSKNTFYSFDYDPNADSSKWDGYRWNINKAYDMDTILAADNDGIPLGDYGVDYGDYLNGKSLFNAVVNPIWVNIQSAFKPELSAIYTTLRGNGAWDSQAIINKWDRYQHKRPTAAMAVDAYNKYIAPYKTSDTGMNYDNSYLPRMQGSKTYWRRQFLTYQTSYMDGKYSTSLNKGDAIAFRTNCGSENENVYIDFEVKAYAKTYITAIVDNNKAGTQKVLTGQTTTIYNVGAGTNTTLYFTPVKLIQYIRPLNETLNSTFTASGAEKLMEVNLGGGYTIVDPEADPPVEEPIINEVWTSGEVSIPSVILKELSVKDLVNFTGALDLSQNVELEVLDSRNTKAGTITLPNSAPLRSVQLNACTGIKVQNLYDVETFTLESGENLTTILVENCNNVLSNAIANYLTVAVDTQSGVTKRIRATNVNWTFNDVNDNYGFNTIYKCITQWKGFNNLGEFQDKPVITGDITVGSILLYNLEQVHNIIGSGSVTDCIDANAKTWSSNGLTIHYEELIPYYTVTFLNIDGNPILDSNGNNYIQPVIEDQYCLDPTDENNPLIDTPTYGPTPENTYEFIGWKSSTQNSLFNFSETRITSNVTLTAQYNITPRTYTVTWYKYNDDPTPKIVTGIPYGTAVYYDDDPYNFPTRDSSTSATKYVFKGWDKSTSYIMSDLTVHGIWELGRQLSSDATTRMNQATPAQIYATALGIESEAITAPAIWTDPNLIDGSEYIEINVGKDFDSSYFPIPQSDIKTLVSLDNPMTFNGTSAGIKKFDGVTIFNNETLPEIKLFKDNKRFTLALDYEVYSGNNGSCVLNCEGDHQDATSGFRIVIDQGYCKFLWGDTDLTKAPIIGAVGTRNTLVIRYNGSDELILNYNNTDIANNSSDYAIYNGAIGNSAPTRTQLVSTNGVLTFGGIDTNWASTYATSSKIYWCKLWYYDVGTRDAKALAAWHHDTWKFLFTNPNSNGYPTRKTLPNSNGYTAALEFILQDPLPLYKTYEQNKNIWNTTDMRSFLNGQIFDALPVEWQYIIRQVELTSNGYTGVNGQSTGTSEDKLYLVSNDDLTSINNFNMQQERIKFAGIKMDSTMQIYTTEAFDSVAQVITDSKFSNDPSTYVSATEGRTNMVSGKTIWIKPSAQIVNNNTRSQVGFIYFDNDYLANHNFVCGRSKNYQYNLTPTNTNINGKWIQASIWMLRDHENYDAYYEGWNVIGCNGALTHSYPESYYDQPQAIIFEFSI